MKVMFCACQRIYLESEYTGVPVVVQVEPWENGICTVVMKAGVSTKSMAAVGAPSDRGDLWFVIPASRLYSG